MFCIKGRHHSAYKSTFTVIGGIAPEGIKEMLSPKFEINYEHKGILDISDFN